MRNLWKTGDPFIWLTGGALALAILAVTWIVGLLFVKGTTFFWPRSVLRAELADGTVRIGELVEREPIFVEAGEEGREQHFRVKFRQGNRDLYGQDFVWVDESEIKSRTYPPEILAIERLEWGNFYGVPLRLVDGEKVDAEGYEQVRKKLSEALSHAEKMEEEIRNLEQDEIGELTRIREKTALELAGLEKDGSTDTTRMETLRKKITESDARYETLREKLGEMRNAQTAALVMVTADGSEKEIPVSEIVHSYFPNQMGAFSKLGYYLMKFWEFLAHEPRESNTEGGIFPAIFGTIAMVFLMTLFVTPLGVIAAFYLREYARQGPFVSLIRVAVNNLAGVPSIVYGVFGVGFFIYLIGGTIDQFFFSEALPTPTFGTGGLLWASLTLALLTVPVVIVATEEGLAAIPKGLREGSLALGATKFETTWRIVFPAVLPSLLTGVILAIARAAGEVAPLMLTGVVKLAPTLPVDAHWPFIHLERKFMHLGFHIYDVGFQSPNVDAARPMVFATALLLLALVVGLNLAAIALRNRLRRRFALSAV